MKKHLASVSAIASIVSLAFSITAPLIPNEYPWTISWSFAAIILFIVGLWALQAPHKQKASKDAAAARLPRKRTLLLAPFLVAAGIALLLALGRMLPRDDSPALDQAAPFITPNPTRISATVAGVTWPSAAAVDLPDANCSGSSTTTTIWLGGQYNTLDFRLAIAGGAGSDAYVQVDILDGSGPPYHRVLTTGSGLSITAQTSHLNSLVVSLTNLRHLDQTCRESNTRVVFLDIVGRA